MRARLTYGLIGVERPGYTFSDLKMMAHALLHLIYWYSPREVSRVTVRRQSHYIRAVSAVGELIINVTGYGYR